MRNQSMDYWNHDKYWADGSQLAGLGPVAAREWIAARQYSGGLYLQKAQEEDESDVTAEFVEAWVADEVTSYRGGIEQMMLDVPFIARWWKL